MFIAAVLCLCAAVATAGLGLWSLTRPRSGDPNRQLLRMVAPTQLAGAVMLAAGGAVALVAPDRIGLLALLLGVVGALATIGAGCWQGAKTAAALQAAATADEGCAGSCAACTLSCGR
ncbi:hypothetical protein [uncultured Mycolicibacterium sp.]|uniref:hypothetical protein n=1 Tax=uncultured Mycolicibacterium sp. TaxID=2320817 RepID=UPI00262CDDEF|nr:hypothetical protein [uncultured Mycolicibacterium sp.]